MKLTSQNSSNITIIHLCLVLLPSSKAINLDLQSGPLEPYGFPTWGSFLTSKKP